MLHPLALHVPWLKRDKLVFVSFLREEEKLEWDLKSDVKTGFAEKSHWSSESHPEQLRPPGTEPKGYSCDFSLPSESSHSVTFPGVCPGFSFKKGWGEALRTILYQTPLPCILWAWKLRHLCLHSLNLLDILPCTFSVKRISCWFPFLKTDLTKWWTASNFIKLNACAELLAGFGPYACM